MTEPFNAPASASGITWEDINGALLLITPEKLETGIKTSFGDKDAMRAHVVVLDGPQAGTEYADTLIFPGVLISQLRPSAGSGKVLGRLGQGNAKPGQKPPWLLSEATDADKAVAVAYINRTPAFAAPATAAPAGQPPF